MPPMVSFVEVRGENDEDAGYRTDHASSAQERTSGLSKGLGYAQEGFRKSDLCRRTLMRLINK